MKATSKILSAPPDSSLGGSAYSSAISRHVYASKRPPRKAKVKRDVMAQFRTCTVVSDNVQPHHSQAARLSNPHYTGDPLAVSKAAGKAHVKTIAPSYRRHVLEQEPMRPSANLSELQAQKVLAELQAKKQAKVLARLERKRIRKEQELANLRTIAHLHVKSVEKRAKERNAFKSESKFGIGDAFAKVGL